MRQHKLALLAVISLAALALLLSTYAVGAHFDFWHMPATGTEGGKELTLDVYNGMAGVTYARITKDASRFFKSAPPGFHFYHRFQFGHAGLPVSFWRFDAGSTSLPGASMLGAVCSVWSLAILCFIAPVFWIGRHRRRKLRGFAVEPLVEQTH